MATWEVLASRNTCFTFVYTPLWSTFLFGKLVITHLIEIYHPFYINPWFIIRLQEPVELNLCPQILFGYFFEIYFNINFLSTHRSTTYLFASVFQTVNVSFSLILLCMLYKWRYTRIWCLPLNSGFFCLLDCKNGIC